VHDVLLDKLSACVQFTVQWSDTTRV